MSYIIRIRLAKQDYQIYKPAYPEKPEGKQPEQTRSDLPLIKAVYAEFPEEKAKQKRKPLIFRSAAGKYRVYIVVGVVYNDRLGRSALKLLDLSSSVCADHRVHMYFVSAEFAELHSVVQYRDLRGGLIPAVRVIHRSRNAVRDIRLHIRRRLRAYRL